MLELCMDYYPVLNHNNELVLATNLSEYFKSTCKYNYRRCPDGNGAVVDNKILFLSLNLSHSNNHRRNYVCKCYFIIILPVLLTESYTNKIFSTILVYSVQCATPWNTI